VCVLFCKVSDDEDDTHPNIDTPSLFRWRHQARLERMDEAKREKDELVKKKKELVVPDVSRVCVCVCVCVFVCVWCVCVCK
jgi:hypothetical protein